MRTLSLSKSGNGHGIVRTLGGGIDCGVSCMQQSFDYDRLAQVDLVVTPAPDSFFAGWSGDGVNVSLPGQASVVRHVGMWDNRSVTATFTLGPWLKADLVVQRLAFVAGSPRIEFRVKNIGAAPSMKGIVRVHLQQVRVVTLINGRVQIFPLVGGNFAQDLDARALLPGTFQNFSLSYSVVPPLANSDASRLMSVLVTADVGNLTEESTETNNTASIHGSLQGGVYA